MKRPATDVLRRGFDNALANWQLILIRVAEGIVFLAIVFGAIIASIVPLLISIGLSRTTWGENPADSAEAVLDAITGHWMVLVYIFFIISFVMLLVVAIHSFVAAGCALVYVDGERRTAALAAPQRQQFRSFTGQRWFGGGKDGWWTVFWIYNIAWGVAGLVMCAPLVVVLAVMLAVRGTGPAPMIATGCVGLAVSVMFMIVVGIVTNIWGEKAVVDAMARNLGAGAALRSSWREMRTDTARHLGVAIVMIAIAIGGSMFLSSFSWIGAMNHSTGFTFATMPLRFSASFAQTLFSSAVGAWFLASFAGLAVEK